MHDILFYIYFIITVYTVFASAFSRSNKKTALYSVTALFSAAGLFTLLRFEFIAFLILTGISVSASVYVLFFNFFKQADNPENGFIKGRAITVIIISMITAIFAGLTASTRIEDFSDNTAGQNYSIIFSKYLPVVLLTVLLISVIISFALTLNRKEDEV